jgi:hypothetical protein
MSLSNEYKGFINADDSVIDGSGNLHKLRQLISLSYFQSSLKNIPNVLSGKSHPIATSQSRNASTTKLADGSVVYGPGYASASSEVVAAKVEKFIQGDVYSLVNYNEVSPKITHQFEHMVKDMNRSGIRLILFLAPYHPKAFNVVKRKYAMVLAAEDYIRDFAAKNRIAIVGSFDPILLGLNAKDFYDGMHASDSSVREIVSGKFELPQAADSMTIVKSKLPPYGL